MSEATPSGSRPVFRPPEATWAWPYRAIGYTYPEVLPETAKPWLNLGCGGDYRDGWVNVDLDPTGSLKIDRQMDFRKIPWPLEDASFGLVYMGNVIEHIPHEFPGVEKNGFIAVLEEIHRILRPGGYAVFTTPHWRAEDVVRDPTHTRAIHPWNFIYFTPDYPLNFYSEARFVLLQATPTKWWLRGNFLRMGRHRMAVGEHFWVRAPFLRPLLRRSPTEMRYVLRKA